MKKGLLGVVGLFILTFLVGCGMNPSAQYVRTSWVEGMEGNNYLIETKEELDAYYTEYKDVYYLNDSFVETMNKYDKSYFIEKSLVLILLEEGSGSISHKVQSCQNNDGYINVTIDRNTPKYGTCDMAGWHIFVEVDKSMTTDYLGINVEQI